MVNWSEDTKKAWKTALVVTFAVFTGSLFSVPFSYLNNMLIDLVSTAVLIPGAIYFITKGSSLVSEGYPSWKLAGISVLLAFTFWLVVPLLILGGTWFAFRDVVFK